MLKLEDLMILPELETAIRPLNPKERAGLVADIIKEKRLHNPLLYAHLEGGQVCLIDGHTRHSIITGPDTDGHEIEAPELKEVESLRNATVADAVDWIQRHQAHRRNDETLAKQYEAGKAYRAAKEDGLTSFDVADKFGMTASQVRHAARMADKVDAADAAVPGAKEAILESSLAPSEVRNAESPAELLEAVEKAKTRTVHERKTPQGPLASFVKMTNALGSFTRSLRVKTNESGPNEWSEGIEKHLKSLTRKLEEWQTSEAMSHPES